MKCYPIKTEIRIAGKDLGYPIFYGGSLTNEYPCILGQDFFFDQAKVTFERYNWSFGIDWV